MPHLVVQQPDSAPGTVELGQTTTIGRQEASSVVLADAKASRRHATIVRDAQGFTLTDAGSTHGTFINGEPSTVRRLEDGDRIQIGQVLLTFCEGIVASEILHRQKTQPSSHDAEAKLRLFYEVAAAIGEIEDPDALLGRMLAAILDVLGCERGLVGLVEPAGMRRVTRVRADANADIVLARVLIDSILGRREGLIVREPLRGGSRARVLSAMGVPLLAGTRVLGLLYVDAHGAETRFSSEDLSFLAALGHLTAAALESAERYRKASEGEPTSAEAAMAALVGESAPMAALRREIQRYAASTAHVLIQGESGTGKELVARALCASSPRAARPLVTLNCAAIPETMVESELFGFEKGAFTGAVKDKRGKFALAHGGTLFLDEIGDLGLSAQAKVLRAIQEGEVQPVGAEKPLHVDVRILAATHKNLSEEVKAGRFREDLYYRLAVVEVVVPKLRDRGEDVVLLAHRLLVDAARRLGKPLAGFSDAALAALRSYPWPGNVRELQNECERAAILAEGPMVEDTALRARVRDTPASPSLSLAGPSGDPLPPAVPERSTLAARFAQLEPTERALVEEALTVARGNITEAARLLGVSRIMIRRRVEKFGLSMHDEE